MRQPSRKVSRVLTMGLRGPSPKPTSLRVLEGVRGHRPLNDQQPNPSGRASPPRWLSRRARAQWRRLAPTLEACGLLTAADETAFAGYCDAVANYIAATRKVEREGQIIESPQGPRVAPWVRAQGDYLEKIIKLGQRFGLTPSDRTGIKVSRPAEGKWASLLG